MLLPGNWPKITRVMNFREKFLVSLVILVVLSALVFWIRFAYLDKTVPIPKRGGEYAEGIIGQPIYLNPLLSQTSEADSDLARLIFSSLLKYDGQGNLVPDLAERYEISDDRLTYKFFLRQDVLWHDGEKLDADDVAYTVSTLKDPRYKSPLRQSWEGVEAQKVDDYTVEFRLSKPYFGFLNKLNLGILPRHIWENTAGEKFILAEHNLKPVGSGPYAFSSLQKDSEGTIASVRLVSNPHYYGGDPFIPEMTFNFYPDEDEAVAAYNNHEVNGLGNLPLERIPELKNLKSTAEHRMTIPRYYAVFFNQTKSVPLSSDGVRKALSRSADRDRLIREILLGRGISISSPVLPGTEAYSDEAEKYTFDPERARQELDESGWTLNAEKGVREKDGAELAFRMITIEELLPTAALLKEGWEEIGARVEVEALPTAELYQEHIRTRDYEAILFGQENSFDMDLSSFWHSSFKQDPGLNLALFDNRQADTLLEEARQSPSREEWIAKYQEFQNILAEKAPAVFLYSPYYSYPVSDQVQGIAVERVGSSSDRFSEADKWFIKTRRVRK